MISGIGVPVMILHGTAVDQLANTTPPGPVH